MTPGLLMAIAGGLLAVSGIALIVNFSTIWKNPGRVLDGGGMGPMVARVVDQVGGAPLWFRQQLRRRLEKNTSGWPELDRSHIREVMDQIEVGE